MLARRGAHEAGPTRQVLSIILRCSVMPRARSKTPSCRSENVVHCTNLKGFGEDIKWYCVCVLRPLTEATVTELHRRNSLTVSSAS